MPALDPRLEALLRRHHAEVVAALPDGTVWFDAHTHIGSNDPDGFKATAAEILRSFDDAGQRGGLVFPMHEPDGYPPANDHVLAEAQASGGRLVALCRVDPKTDDAVAEARRCLDAGARGIKLHPRAEGFQMSNPTVEELVALAGERNLPVLIHAGRGIPALGADTADLARRHPGARLILAHAGISDLAWIWREAAELSNLFFDSSWWSITDLVALFALVPPGQILYASDAPYGFGLMGGILFLRAGLAVGLGPEVLAQMAGAQTQRLAAGEEPRDLGPAPGLHGVQRGIHGERVVSHIYTAVGRAFGGSDPRESLALASLACEVPDGDPEAEGLRPVAELIEMAAQAEVGEGWRRPFAAPAITAAALAGTPGVLDGVSTS